MSERDAPETMTTAFTVNGRAVALAVPAHALLLDVLRDRLGLKGAKRSCDVQVCGACTVLVDGAPVSACTYLAVEVDGREVLTVEGLGSRGALHPLQEAFIDHGAAPVRLLHGGHAAERQGAARRGPRADPRARRALPARQPLPLHGLSQDRRGHPGLRDRRGARGR